MLNGESLVNKRPKETEVEKLIGQRSLEEVHSSPLEARR